MRMQAAAASSSSVSCYSGPASARGRVEPIHSSDISRKDSVPYRPMQERFAPPFTVLNGGLKDHESARFLGKAGHDRAGLEKGDFAFAAIRDGEDAAVRTDGEKELSFRRFFSSPIACGAWQGPGSSSIIDACQPLALAGAETGHGAHPHGRVSRMQIYWRSAMTKYSFPVRRRHVRCKIMRQGEAGKGASQPCPASRTPRVGCAGK